MNLCGFFACTILGMFYSSSCTEVIILPTSADTVGTCGQPSHFPIGPAPGTKYVGVDLSWYFFLRAIQAAHLL